MMNYKNMNKGKSAHYSTKRILARYKNSGVGSNKGMSHQQTREKGKYTLVCTKMYDNLTDKQMELKEQYALDIVSNYSSINRKYLHLKQYASNKTLTTDTLSYYVKYGKIILGKISIRQQYTFKRDILIISFKEKG